MFNQASQNTAVLLQYIINGCVEPMAAENSKGLVHGVEYPNFEAVVCESLAS